MLQFYFKRISLLAVFGLLTFPLLFASTIFVTSTADAGDGSLRAAVAAAESGDTIRFNSAILGQTIRLSSEIVIDKSLRIRGNGIGNTVISGGGSTRIFNVTAESSVYLGILEIVDGATDESGGAILNPAGQLQLDGVRVSGSSAGGTGVGNGGGAVASGGRLLVTASQFVGNSATGAAGSGGAILSTGGGFAITGTTFTGNTSTRAGGAIEISGEASGSLLNLVTMTGNTTGGAPGNGGGLHITGASSLTVKGGTFTNNTAAREGGALWNGTGLMTVREATIDNNTASGPAADDGGGGIFNNGGILRIFAGTRITNNVADGTAGSGGGVFNATGGTLQVVRANISGNTANRAGGGIEDASGGGTMVIIAATTVDSNEVFTSPGNGGGIHVGGDGNISFRSGTVRGNKAGAEGGGIWIASGTLTVGQNVVFDGNEAAGNDPDQGGGALYSVGNGTMIIKNGVTFRNNKATGTSGSGGAILNNSGATLLIDGATFTGNTANRAGGAIEDVSGDDGGFSGFRINKSEFTENSVGTAPGNGGAIHLSGDGDLLLVNSNFTGNTAGSEGGAVWNNAGTMKIQGGSFTNNVANGAGVDNGGGAIFNNGGTMNVIGITATGNQATGGSGSGGALLTTGGNMTVIASTFTGNTANRAGGAVEQIDGLYSSTNNTYEGNTVGFAPGNGGAFHVTGTGSTVIINGGSVVNNRAGNEGGGLWNQAGTTMSVNGVAIRNNTVTGVAEGDAGGGIFNNGGVMDVSNATIAGNTVAAELTLGGGIFNKVGGDFTLTNSTVSGNTTGGAGGGIANEGTFDLVNGTVAFNTAFAGGGYSQISQTASLSVTGTIISDNDATGDFWEDFSTNVNTMTSGGFNLIGNDDQDNFEEVATDIVNGRANLEPLAANGGATMTHALTCPSDAVDAGNPADLTSDQTGQASVGTRDIGAYESPVSCSRRATVDGGLVIDAVNLLDAGLSLFPNPTGEGAVNVNIPEVINGEVVLRLLDGNGRVRLERRTNTTGNFRFPLQDLPNGTYTLQVINGAQLAVRRLIKMN